jgi:transposase-like protein
MARRQQNRDSRDTKKGAKHYAPEVRAAAMAALLAGQGVNEVAAQYRLPKQTVSRWRKQARTEADRSDDVGALLLAYLRENLITLREQAVTFRDPRWLKRQSAADAGVLHGILTDKAVRLLEAMEPSARPE